MFREIIQETRGDIVIVVPSRALISEYYFEIISLVENDVLVLQFVEDVNKALVRRRIFIVTPERAVQVFKQKERFNIDLFMLDEAQLSEEGFRGLRFDAFVRRVSRVFTTAKIVFAHPFVDNPEAQLQKHGFVHDSGYDSFNQQAVGKIFLHYNDKDRKFYYFTPNADYEEIPAAVDIAKEVLERNGTMLIYISKAKIYDGTYRMVFGDYIDMCPRLTDSRAHQIIKSLREFIGAQGRSSGKRSNLIELMERGVVTHHGSMPLKARLIVEQFIKEGMARICFATSTLNQGINMPFDVVWIDNFWNVKDLTLKNLIGRAGRTSQRENDFDFGYAIIKKENVSSFTSRYKDTYKLSPLSLLDAELDLIDDDDRDVVEAIREDKFNDDLHLPEVQIDRIKKADIDSSVKFVLDSLFRDGKVITGSVYYALKKSTRERVKQCFKAMFVVHLRRKQLESAEASVLSAAIPILLWHIQGRSFAEIVSLRHSYLTMKTDQNRIHSQVKAGEITDAKASELYRDLKIRFSQVPSPLPNKTISKSASFPFVHVGKLDYDSLVYDTYDYLDKVISLSLADPLCAVLEAYFFRHHDERARTLVNYIRFGTNDETEIWLLKYGFAFNDIDWIKECIDSVSGDRIIFNRGVEGLSPEKFDLIKRYV